MVRTCSEIITFQIDVISTKHIRFTKIELIHVKYSLFHPKIHIMLGFTRPFAKYKPFQPKGKHPLMPKLIEMASPRFFMKTTTNHRFKAVIHLELKKVNLKLDRHL